MKTCAYDRLPPPLPLFQCQESRMALDSSHIEMMGMGRGVKSKTKVGKFLTCPKYFGQDCGTVFFMFICLLFSEQDVPMHCLEMLTYE